MKFAAVLFAFFFALSLAPAARYDGTTSDHGDFYIAGGKQIPLLRADEEIAVQFVDEVSVEDAVAHVRESLGDESVERVFSLSAHPRIDVFHVASAESAEQTLSLDEAIAYLTPVFLYSGIRTIPSPFVILGAADGIDEAGLQAVLPEEDVQLLSQLGHFNAWIARVQNPTGERVLAVANALSELPELRFAEPDFYSEWIIGPDPGTSRPFYHGGDDLSWGDDGTCDSPEVDGGSSIKTRKARIDLSGLAADDSGVGRVEYRIGKRGKFRNAMGTERWSVSVPLKPGRNIVQIRVIDGAGNVSDIRTVRIRRIAR